MHSLWLSLFEGKLKIPSYGAGINEDDKRIKISPKFSKIQVKKKNDNNEYEKKIAKSSILYF